ncbi:MAG TPA: SoxR reducing system RseC family protein [Paludibacteraceae bacterium]|nr:SoxR reducing system RseC family protein [Paludibacteraceae bacterium]HOL00875.1 SoxR reducing system RseC family protein [Paludibacteraceae bacterium]HPO67812.1 SoxR reducing system RseC family protein [Paludibacteraceae bacterium]HRU64104.1 SoxR reducing system RseC family protein [Paludibacteraceae bacterium]
MSQSIEHSGIVEQIDGDQIKVLIMQQSACSECHAKSLCSIADKKEKIIEVISSDPTLKVGDKVIIYGESSIGLQAVLLAFIIPFVLIFLALFIFQHFIENELIAGILAILVLVPYYLILFLSNKRLKNKFQFKIKKEDTI